MSKKEKEMKTGAGSLLLFRGWCFSQSLRQLIFKMLQEICSLLAVPPRLPAAQGLRGLGGVLQERPSGEPAQHLSPLLGPAAPAHGSGIQLHSVSLPVLLTVACTENIEHVASWASAAHRGELSAPRLAPGAPLALQMGRGGHRSCGVCGSRCVPLCCHTQPLLFFVKLSLSGYVSFLLLLVVSVLTVLLWKCLGSSPCSSGLNLLCPSCSPSSSECEASSELARSQHLSVGTGCSGFVWAGLAVGGSRCGCFKQRASPVSGRARPVSSGLDPLLPKAWPVSDGGKASVMDRLEKGKKMLQQKGVRK
ncbi:uncharacterized protein LOC133629381 [Colius striatus]|uniref:uncharacterized protein LOC133629381 n=1 Tax=Colius striatus TaxID=57412 RepID=UPI002B1D7DEC|nr:uncharacterized protein LOC133629381 [Colius striatus]